MNERTLSNGSTFEERTKLGSANKQHSRFLVDFNLCINLCARYHHLNEHLSPEFT